MKQEQIEQILEIKSTRGRDAQMLTEDRRELESMSAEQITEALLDELTDAIDELEALIAEWESEVRLAVDMGNEDNKRFYLAELRAKKSERRALNAAFDALHF